MSGSIHVAVNRFDIISEIASFQVKKRLVEKFTVVLVGKCTINQNKFEYSCTFLNSKEIHTAMLVCKQWKEIIINSEIILKSIYNVGIKASLLTFSTVDRDKHKQNYKALITSCYDRVENLGYDTSILDYLFTPNGVRNA